MIATGLALVLALVGGRFLAVETAERAWAATILSGSVYLDARTLARLVQIATILLACFWGVANFYIVYRAIGSVQMPRQVGNLEIVEAVPQRVLLGLTIVIGLVFGIGLAWGTEDWWLELLLASAPPVFGRTDPVLHHDLGWYVGTLPWEITRQRFFLLATLTASLIIGILYMAIGSLRFERRRPIASPHARVHLGVLLAGLALAIVWGAVLDPAEAVAGLHGPVDAATVDVRIPGATWVVVAGGLAALATLIWIWWGRPGWLITGWSTLVAVMLAVYAIAPPLARSSHAGSDSTLALARRDLTRIAFGAPDAGAAPPPQFASLAEFTARVPLWDESRVAAVAHRWVGAHQTVGGVTLGNGREWLVAPTPDDTALTRSQISPTWEEVHRGSWSAAGAPFRLLEADSGLMLAPSLSTDTVQWFGPVVAQYAVVDADRHPALAGAGIPVTGGWRRLALAWTLQSPELVRATTLNQLLLWRRGATDRFNRLAPFAEFEAPVPLVADGTLWWVAYGYVGSEVFPLVDATRWHSADLRYLRAGLIGAVRAGTGETRLWQIPGGDPVAAAWARLLAPIIQPAESLPPALRNVLPMPVTTFRQAERTALAELPDSGKWRRVAADPFEIPAPLAQPAATVAGESRPWIGQAFAAGTPGHYVGFLAGRMTPDGPNVQFITPPAGGGEPVPGPVVGAAETMPGVLRLWPTLGHIAAAQGRFERAGGGGGTEGAAAPVLERVFLSWGDRTGEGSGLGVALRSLLSSGSFGNAADTTLTGRWRDAQALAARADSALAAGNLEEFARLYQQLSQLLRHRGGAALAPAPTPR